MHIDAGVAVSRSGSVISTVVSPHIADMYSKRCALFSESRCGVVCHWDVPAETSVLPRISPSPTFHSALSFSHSARTLSYRSLSAFLPVCACLALALPFPLSLSVGPANMQSSFPAMDGGGSKESRRSLTMEAPPLVLPPDCELVADTFLVFQWQGRYCALQNNVTMYCWGQRRSGAIEHVLERYG